MHKQQIVMVLYEYIRLYLGFLDSDILKINVGLLHLLFYLLGVLSLRTQEGWNIL